MRHRIHRLLSHAWMRPVLVIGWLRALPRRVEALCQRRSAHHLLRSLDRTPAELAASIARRRRRQDAG